jgi:hypothetical protein
MEAAEITFIGEVTILVGTDIILRKVPLNPQLAT